MTYLVGAWCANDGDLVAQQCVTIGAHYYVVMGDRYSVQVYEWTLRVLVVKGVRCV